MKKIKILLILVLSCLCFYLHAQVLFNVRQLSNCNEFQVSLTPNTNYSTPFNLTNSAQVTLVVPTGSVSFNSLTDITGNWTFIGPIITAPPENPSFDYLNFQLTNSTGAINYQTGIEVPLFTINTTRNCSAGNVALMDNTTDPFIFPNSQNVNVGNSITIFGAGGNAYSGNYGVNGGTNTNNSSPTTGTCLIEYEIAQVGNNLFQVSLTPDVTWTGIDAHTSTAQVSIRVPTGTLSIGNLTNNIPTAIWTLNSSYINPPENPGWDYYSFGLQYTQDIPYTQGVSVGLFQFENLGICPSSIVLIDNDTDPFMQPNSQNANIEQHITISGWQMADVPVCIAGSVAPTCPTTTNQPIADDCLIEYQISQIGTDLFQVSLTPDTTWTGINSHTSTAQVSIRVPTGTLNIGNLTNNIPNAIWTLNSSHINPPENPGWDYYSFGLEYTQSIPYFKGQTVNLFQFQNFGICPSSIILIDNDTDPLMQPNSQNANVQQQITISGWQMADVPVCVAGGLTPACPVTNPPVSDECLIEYHLSSVGGNLFQVSLTPDTTWTGINAFTATGQVSFRVPTGSFIMGSVINNIPTAVWTLNSKHLSPPENPGWDYYSFGLEFTQDIPYFKGQTVNLFQFQNAGICAGDSIFLIDNATDPLMQPNSQNANIEQQLTVSGWQMEDLPICISAGTSAACCDCDGAATPPPSNMISATRECMGDATQFTCPITNGVSSVFWNFGDGVGSSNLKNPTYVYQDHGTYPVTLTINYTNGTSTILTKDVIVDPMIWPLVRTLKDTVCVGECVRLQAQGGNTYAWSPTTTMDDPTFFSPVVCPTTTTTYSVIISNDTGCSATGDVTIYVTNPPVVQTINDITVCKGEPATLGIANGTGVFQWGPVGTIVNGTIENAIANPITTTEYCVTLTDTHGCTASDCMIVTVLQDPVVSAGTDQEICASQTAQLNATGGISYQWSPATNITNTAIPNPIVSPTTTTDYCVTVTDNNGCTSTDCVTIKVNGIATFINNDATICAGQSTLLSATGGISYNWSPSAGLSSTSISNPTASPTSSTNYCVTITNAAGCQEEQCILVSVNNAVTANAGQDVTTCKDQPTQLFASGGISYSWSPSTNLSSTSIGNPIASPVVTTTYCVTATDENGCTDTDCVQVIVENNIVANAGSDQTICSGENVILNASGGSTYRWSPSAGLSNATVPNPVASPSATTTYCVTITDNKGCVDTDCMNLIVDGTIVANAGNDITLCRGNTTQLAASGGTNYRWSPSIGLSNTNSSNPIVTANNTTTYCVTVTDATGCEASDCVNVIVENGTTASAGNDVSICANGTTQLVASGGVSYQWSPTTGLNNANINNPIASPNSSTNYCVTVTSAKGCTSIDCVQISIGNSLSANAGQDQTICTGSNTQLSASGGATYQWSPSNGLSNPNSQNPIASPTVTTTYCVTATDGNSCTGTDCVTITVDNSIPTNAGPDQSICLGSSTQLSASGGTTYQWSPSTGLSNPNIANPISTPNITTTYCVTVTDNKGCTGTDCVSVQISNSTNANAGSDVSTCNGSSVTLNASGGSTYRWMPTTGLSNPNIANPTASVSSPTTYCVTVTDSNGCTGTDCVNVSIDNSISANAGNDVSICNGSSASLNASGGSTYRWSPSAGLSNPNIANPTVSVSSPTTYCVTVTDSNGCTGIDCVNVSIDNSISANAGNDISICSGSSASLNASGGSTYRWSPTIGLSNPNIANPLVSVSSPTTYCVTVTDSNGCTGTDCVNVNVGNSISASAGSDVSICNSTSASLNASGGISYRWSPTTGLSNPNIANPTVSISGSTTYCVTVTDANGCTGTDCVNVNMGETVVANAGSDQRICNGSSAQLNASGGSSYRWFPTSGLSNPNIANPTVNVSIPTSYCVTVMENGKCSSVDCVTVDVSSSLTANAGNDISTCSGASATLNASGGSTYRWAPTTGLSNPNIANPTVNVNTNTTYCVTVTDNNGCSDIDCVNVSLGNNINADAGDDKTICRGTSTQLFATGGTSYSWTPSTGLSNPNIANPTVSPNVTTIYCVNVSSGGCSKIDCVQINVSDVVNANAGNDISTCSGSNITLNASGGNGYSWSPSTGLSNPNIANPTVNISVPTTYCVTVTENGKCAGVDCVTVNINSGITVNAGNDISVCSGTTASLNASGGNTYRWAPTTGLSNPNISNPTVSVTTPTTYCVTATDSNGCSGVDCVVVSIENNTSANAGVDQSICRGTSTQLSASGGTSYSWTPTTGLSNPNIANPTVSPNVTTIYCVNVTNGGCSTVDCVQINVSEEVNANAGNDINTCNGGSTTLNASGGNGYSWFPTTGLSNPNIANPTVNISVPTTYCVTVTDNGKCAGVDCVNVNVHTGNSANAGNDIRICSGDTGNLNASGGNTYRWSPTTGLSNPNISNPTVSVNTNTTFCVTVTDSNGCAGVDCVNVSVGNNIFPNAGSDVSICRGETTQLSASGGTSYSWTPTTGLSNPTSATPSVSPSVTTIYCVNVSNGNCSKVDCVQINVSDVVNANAGNDISICNGSSTTLRASGGSSYRWSPTTGLSNPNIANPNVNVSVPTTYCVTVTDSGKCAGVDCVTVNINGSSNVSAGNDINICNGVSANLNASGGSSYRWLPTAGLSNPNIANPIVNISTPTTYCVTVTDNTGCTGVDCVNVNVNRSTNISAGNDISVCNGASANLNASGGSTYRWSPTTGLSNPNIANPIVNISTPTTYCVTATDNNGCSGVDCVTVTIGSGVAISAGSDIAVCIGNSARLNASGGNSYRWSPTTGLNNPNIASPTVTPTVSTTYCVTVTDSNGCTAQDCVFVSTKKIQSNISNDFTICEGDKINLIATGGDFYSWSPRTSLSNPNIASPIASPTTTTTYCATISAEDCSKQECVTITVIDCTDGSDDGGIPSICNSGVNGVACPDKNICIGESAQLVVNGGDAWSWSPTNTLNNPFASSPFANPVVTTVYTVTVTDMKGCTDVDQVTVFVDNCGVTPGPCVNNPTVVACEDKTICPGETIQLTVTTGLTYQWLPLNNLSNPFSGVPLASPSTTTTYSVTVTDENGCMGVDEVTIFVSNDCANEPSPQPCTEDAFVVACEDKFICKGGSIRLNVTTGAFYEWSPEFSLSHPNVGAPIARPLVTTNYTVTITDENGCTGTDRVTVFVNEAQASAGSDVSICGSPVQLNASGGNTYRWSPTTGLSNPNISNPIANPSSSTIYCVTVTDLDGCTATDCVEVRVGSSFPAVACEDKFICQGANVTLTVTTGASYRWSPSTGLSNVNIGTPVASPSQTTTYFVTVTDAAGCTSVDEVVVNVDPNCTNGRSCPEDILPASPLTIELSDCELSGELCLPIERASVSNYIFTINGVEQTEDAFKACQLNYSFAYTYFTIPDRGSNGLYNLQEWIVDGNTHGGSFEDIEQLITLMNTIDPIGNWEADESTLTLKGGHPDVKYSTMNIEQIASGATATLELNTNISPSETIIVLPVGTNEVAIMLKETGCKVQSIIYVSCPNEVACSNLFMDDRIEKELDSCEDLVEVCLEFPLVNATEYSYVHNGGSFQGNAGFCSLSGTTTALYVGKGEHELIITHLETGCSDTLVVIASCREAVTGESEPSADTDEAITNVNEPIEIDVSANDRSLGTIQSLQIINHPNKGQVFINDNQSIRYEPNEDYCDTEVADRFSYEICNEYGCDVADVMVRVACKPLSVYTGFSPNGDGINDFFKIEGVEEYPNSTLQVFNRWGTLVYQQIGYQNDWDGRYKSNPLADGVYFYLFMDGYGNKQSGYVQISK